MKLSKFLAAMTTLGALTVSADRSVMAGASVTNLPVNVTVTSNCTITATAVAFPAYDPVGTHASTPDDTSSGAVIVACTKGVTASIGLGFGQNATASPRNMKSSAGDLLPYDLYKDAPGGAIWGNAGTAMLSTGAALTKAARTFTVYGRIPSGRDVPATTYSDTVVATVNF